MGPFAWYRQHWYDVGLGVAIAVLAAGVVLDLSVLQQILLLNLAVLFLPEFEEYGWPGGLPTFMNVVMRPGGRPDRYPLNQLNSLAINVPIAYAFYAVPVFFPDVIWLGLAPILFTVFELLIHVGGGVVRARAVYSPGLATVFPWAILAAWYLAETAGKGLVTQADWIYAVVYLVAFMVVGLGLVTYVWLADRDSPYPFAPEEMSRFERYGHMVGGLGAVISRLGIAVRRAAHRPAVRSEGPDRTRR
jgi:hypothetical protein